MKFFYIFLTIIMLYFSGCKKAHRYPEDPKKTRESPKARLEGAWNIYEYTLNGQSILNTANFGYDVTNFTLKQSYNSSTKKYFYTIMNEFNDELYLSFGPFSNVPDCSYIKCFITPLNCSGINKETKWCISKLYDKDLNLTLKTDTGEFKMFLKKRYN